MSKDHLSAGQAGLKAWQRKRRTLEELAMSEELAQNEIKQAQHKLKQAKQRSRYNQEFADEGEPGAAICMQFLLTVDCRPHNYVSWKTKVRHII